MAEALRGRCRTATRGDTVAFGAADADAAISAAAALAVGAAAWLMIDWSHDSSGKPGRAASAAPWLARSDGGRRSEVAPGLSACARPERAAAAAATVP